MRGGGSLLGGTAPVSGDSHDTPEEAQQRMVDGENERIEGFENEDVVVVVEIWQTRKFPRVLLAF